MEQMGREFRAKTVFVGHCVMKICLKMMIVFCSPLGSQQAFFGLYLEASLRLTITQLVKYAKCLLLDRCDSAYM